MKPIPQSNSGLVINHDYGRILSSLFLYFLFQIIILELLFPFTCYLIIATFKLHWIIAPKLLNFILVGNRFTVSLLLPIFFQARCFQANGFRYIAYNKWEIPEIKLMSPYEMSVATILFYLILFFIFYNCASLQSLSFQAGDEFSSLFRIIESGLVDFFKKESIIFYFFKNIRTYILIHTFIYFTTFLLGFNMLVPRSYILGIQRHIWHI